MSAVLRPGALLALDRQDGDLVHLEDGQWLRGQINYRFSSAAGRGDWTYCLQTLNVGCGVADTDVFLGAPGRVIDERAQLA